MHYGYMAVLEFRCIWEDMEIPGCLCVRYCGNIWRDVYWNLCDITDVYSGMDLRQAEGSGGRGFPLSASSARLRFGPPTVVQVVPFRDLM